MATKTQRDMSDAEFRAALKRNGFQLNVFWMFSEETRTGYSILSSHGRIDKRASLAHAIQSRNRDRAKAVAFKAYAAAGGSLNEYRWQQAGCPSRDTPESVGVALEREHNEIARLSRHAERSA